MGRKLTPFTAEMEIIDAASDGRAVARYGEQVIFIEGGVPGDIAEVFVFRKQDKLWVGKIDRLIKASKDRVEARCQHFGLCGGCKWQNMSYEAQLGFKENQVINTLQRIGKITIGETLPIIGCESPFFYRNKLEFSFSDRAWVPKDKLDFFNEMDLRSLGYHMPGMFDKVLDVEECLLQIPVINEIRNELRSYARNQNLSFYNIRDNTGFLRNIVFRTSVSSGELMIILVVNGDDRAEIEPVLSHLENTFPMITDFIWVDNHKVNSVYADLPFHVWKGKPYITERLGEFDFRIRATSFFQTNSKQAAVLYGVVKSFLASILPAGKNRFHTLYDLYSGTGSIGIFVSDLAEKIVGIEYVRAAVEDAWENVRINNLENQFSFYAGDMKDLLTDELIAKEGRPEVIIADPPRQGMAPQVVKKIREMAPEYIIYVSCKPATQARDLEMLDDLYEVIKIQPVDMFPQTAHVENVALLRLRDNR
ncbi:MAG: 23S rRNA (uracil(1939)-C(5))-methyltransferase RlmD [Bacteroidia bacterium]|nr:23S rRNA (uracil(1939)-C(5))-methyltransferase RlmD [Bacteroidia bacterium]